MLPFVFISLSCLFEYALIHHAEHRQWPVHNTWLPNSIKEQNIMYNKVGSESSTEHQDLLDVLTKHVKKLSFFQKDNLKLKYLFVTYAVLAVKLVTRDKNLPYGWRICHFGHPHPIPRCLGLSVGSALNPSFLLFCSCTPWETTGDDSRSWACPPSERPGLSPRLLDSTWSSTSWSTISKVNRIGNLSFYQL